MNFLRIAARVAGPKIPEQTAALIWDALGSIERQATDAEFGGDLTSRDLGLNYPESEVPTGVGGRSELSILIEKFKQRGKIRAGHATIQVLELTSDHESWNIRVKIELNGRAIYEGEFIGDPDLEELIFPGNQAN